jgi:UPF0755 protein
MAATNRYRLPEKAATREMSETNKNSNPFTRTRLALALVLILCIGWGTDAFLYWKRPVDPKGSPLLVDIPPGRGLAGISQDLYRLGIIQRPLYFQLFTRISSRSRPIMAGEYQLSAAMTPGDIIEILSTGKVYLHRVTIPEGFTLRQIATLVSSMGLVAENRFLEVALDVELVRRLEIDGPSLEGYLFPDTYLFPKGMAVEKMIRVMVGRFRQIVGPILEQELPGRGLSVHQIITLASIIEKETGLEEERPLVASVFTNRLRRNMRLESDPTVIYGVEDFAGDITRKHLRTPTPYNTYLITGLPPGPIANPGLSSIQAALRPAQSDYLFFVARKDKTHVFSRTWEEHEKAVRLHQMVR